jgi:hypothetical protein
MGRTGPCGPGRGLFSSFAEPDVLLEPLPRKPPPRAAVEAEPTTIPDNPPQPQTVVIIGKTPNVELSRRNRDERV